MFNKFISIILLLILIFNTFRFEIPYVEYVVLKPYIIKNLCEERYKPINCCEGKCFVEKQLLNYKTGSDQEKSKDTNNSKHSNDSKEYLQTSYLLPISNELSHHYPVRKETYTEFRYQDFIFVPPQSLFFV
jgi:hypothetical protein